MYVHPLSEMFFFLPRMYLQKQVKSSRVEFEGGGDPPGGYIALVLACLSVLDGAARSVAQKRGRFSVRRYQTPHNSAAIPGSAIPKL